ncbi:Putative YLP motif containing 1 [Trichuris trichiura]|uniref:Putative YLP motif containing 1 n=1 Tax=Trichuris trichiura TaxID=36087 RepID=A0A077Z673_TRITR|nr:Putative YLP motif containing 1 [Trichuris trichiura]
MPYEVTNQPLLLYYVHNVLSRPDGKLDGMINDSSSLANGAMMESCESLESTLSKLPNKERNEPAGHFDRRKSFPSVSTRPVGSSWVDEPFPFMPFIMSDNSHKRRGEEAFMKSGKQSFQSGCRLRRPLSVPDVLFEEECEMESEDASAYALRGHPVSTSQPMAKRHSVNLTSARLPSITE